MSTSYNTSKDTKDKDSTETSTYASDSTKTTGGKGKSTTAGVDTDRTTHDTESSTQYGKFNTQYGTTTPGQQQPMIRGQHGQDSEQQQGQRGQSQTEIQQKLKEVGNLLQRAGHLLQDIQCSGGDLQFQSSSQYGQRSGNYSGPYGGYESSQSQQMYPTYGSSGRFENEHRAFQTGRFQEDRDQDRYGFRSERSSGYNRPEESRYESRFERSNTDRFSGFGGPNRPDLAYGEQYQPRRGADQYEIRTPRNQFW
jgi:hypothetical protein